jgi:hypothetical protein
VILEIKRGIHIGKELDGRVGVLFSFDCYVLGYWILAVCHCFRRGAALMVILRFWPEYAHTLNVDSFPLLHCLTWYDVI